MKVMSSTKVFDVIPAHFFRVLTGKNREVYVEALLIIRKAFKQSMHIDRDDLIGQLIDRLSNLDFTFDLTAELEAAGEESRSDTSGPSVIRQEDNTWSGMAHLILRRLTATGWIEMEPRPQTFELQVTLPQYAIDMLGFLEKITQQDTQAYKNYAFTTYSALRTILDPESRDYLFTAFQSAYENCQHLLDALKSLLNNIRRYHRLLGDYIKANDILRGHFEGYQILVNERIFHPMVTRDSVLRFRQPVVSLIGQIMDHEDILQLMASQAVAESISAIPKMHWRPFCPSFKRSLDRFDDMDAVMMEIQAKNNSYTKASTDKLIYLLNQDRSVKEQLAQIIMQYQNLPQAAGGDCMLVILPCLKKAVSFTPDHRYRRIHYQQYL